MAVLPSGRFFLEGAVIVARYGYSFTYNGGVLKVFLSGDYYYEQAVEAKAKSLGYSSARLSEVINSINESSRRVKVWERENRIHFRATYIDGTSEEGYAFKDRCWELCNVILEGLLKNLFLPW